MLTPFSLKSSGSYRYIQGSIWPTVHILSNQRCHCSTKCQNIHILKDFFPNLSYYAYTHMNPLYNKPLKQFWKAFWEGSVPKYHIFSQTLPPDHFVAFDTDLSYGLPPRSLDASLWRHRPQSTSPFICIYRWCQSGHIVLILHLRKGTCSWTWPLVEP